jgi:hypothetical protein
MLRRLRDLWRGARSVPALRVVIASVDRAWWARSIRRADIVDLEFVRAQGFRTVRSAVRAYVRGGHRDGVSLNPLLLERLVASQLSEAERVPALYAYLVNDVSAVHTSTSWDAPAYAHANPESLTAAGGPVGHAWRTAQSGGAVEIGHGHARRAIGGHLLRQKALEALERRREPNPPPRLGDAVSAYICRIGRREPEAARAIGVAIQLATGERHRTVVALSDFDAGEWADAALLELWLDGAIVVRDSPDIVARWEHAAASGCLLVTRGHDAEISAEDARKLSRATDGGTAAPLWLDLDGTVVAAGLIAHMGRAYGLLAGHPAEDALRLGPTVKTAGLAGDTYARVAHGRRTPVITLTNAIVRAPRFEVGGQIDAPDDDVDALVAPTGLRVDVWTPKGPMYARLAVGSPSLRWAIKIAAPAGRPGEAWGDTHFARGLADALRRLGQEVVIDSYSARDRPSTYLDDVVLALRGPEPFSAQPGARSLLWVISHPDQITAQELEGFDAVFAGSSVWAKKAAQRFGREVTPLLQCTDPHRFRPAGLPRGDELVFVGTARGIARPSIVEPIRAGIPVDVYGPDWRGYIPASAIRGTGVPNEELPVLYESARAVLNDHWPAMQAEGFVSNRLYDVVAAGGRVISDHVEGIDDIFRGAALTYRNVSELIELLRGDLDAHFPAEDALAHIAARVREEHSFDARARTLLDAALAVRTSQEI